MGRVQRTESSVERLVSGGTNALVRTMKSFDISNRDTDIPQKSGLNSLWPVGQDHKKNRHGLQK